MAELFEYAQLAGRVYSRTDQNRTPVPDGWSELSWQKDDGVTGFSAGAYQKGTEIVISFAGTNQTMWKDFVVANIPAGGGLSSAQITQAMTFVLDTMKANPSTTISFTGHSLGGGLASVMAVFFDQEATLFDPAPFELSARNPVVLGSLQAYLLANDYNNAAFDAYSQSLGALFSQREIKVRSYSLDGEVLEPLRVAIPVIAGSETEISAGHPSILDTLDPRKLFGGSVTLHSMTLLHSIMLSPSFAEAVKQQQRAIEVFFDSALYAYNPETSVEPDFMTLMLNQELADSAGEQGMLGALAADLLRIDKIGTAGTKEINLGILAVLTEYYRYLKDPGKQGFIELVDGGIMLDLSRITGRSDHRGQGTLFREIRNWMNDQGVQGLSIRDAERVIIQSGSENIHIDQTGDSKPDLVIGGSQDDEIAAGGSDDVLVGLNGADTLDGGSGNDDLYGGEGSDLLTGGVGADNLDGGAGVDTYRFSIGDGIDLIHDADGQGSIVVDGKPLTGGRKVADGYWISDDKQFGFALVENGAGGHDLVISRGRTDSIRIRDWKNNQLGIALDDTPADIAPLAFQITGDMKPAEFESVDSDGNVRKYYQYDAYGNVITAQAQPGFADVLFGSPDNDKLSGGDGNDAISGYAGDDSIEGGTGDDLLSGGAGQDRILGGDGNDYIFAGGTYNGTRVPGPQETPYEPPADAKVVGATWAVYPSEVLLDGKPTTTDTIQSNGGDDASDVGDIVDAGAGDDFVDGGYGDDVIDGGDGKDNLRGGAGNDAIEGGAGDDWIGGDNTRFGILIGDVSAADHGNDVLSGGEGADTLFGQGGSDELYGGKGDDLLWGDNSDLKDTPAEFAGQDYLDGGDDNDQLVGGGGADVLLGGDGADKLFGDEQSTELDAQYQGDDEMDGGAGDDYAEGGGGSDEINGGADNDTLWGDATAAVLGAEHHGDDVLDGGDGNDNLVGNGGSDYLTGGAGNDQLLGDSASDDDSIAGQYQGDDLLDGGDGDDYLEGGGAADILLGGSGDDQLLGDGNAMRVSGEFAGDDVLQAGDGNDSAWGGGGNDLIEGEAGNDYLHGDDAADGLEGQFHGNDDLSGGVGNDTLIGGGGADYLDGGAGNDYLRGDDEALDAAYHGDDVLSGGDGDDVLIGDGGNDELYGDAGNDVLSAGSGDDLLDGGEGSNALEGGMGNDELHGGSQADALSGGDGDDLLAGGGGRDLLKGGAGSDTYAIAGGEALIQDVDGVNTLLWQDAAVDLDAVAKGEGGGLSVTLVDFAADGSADGAAYGFQGSTNDLVSVAPQPLAGQYVRLESAGASALIQGGLDADFGDIIDAAGRRLSWEQLLAQAVSGRASPYRAVDNSRWYGTGGDDKLTSATPGYKFVGGQGNDTIAATGSGNTFFYAPGDGTDTLTIVDPGAGNGGNTLRFGPGITPDDIRLGLGSLLIRVGENSADAIHIKDFNPDDVLQRHPVDRFEFADGTVLSYEELLRRGFDLDGSKGNDTIRGTNVADRIAGREGNDTLQGGAGDDTYAYRLGDGKDKVLDTDTTASNLDRLRLGAGILTDGVTVTRNYRDVTLTFTDGGSVTLAGQLEGEGRGIERVEFADGTVWSPADLLARATFVMPAPQNIEGTDGNDFLTDQDGNDRIVGRFGNDVIRAGYGDDSLYGAYTYDAFWWGDGLSEGGFILSEGPGGVVFADDDEMHGGEGNDWLDGGYRADHDPGP